MRQTPQKSGFGPRPALFCVALCLVFCCTSASAQDSGDVDKANIFYQQAIQQFNKGHYREALASFDEAIKLDPNPIFFCNRSSVLLKLDEGREALASMEICLERLEFEDANEHAQIHAEVEALRMAIRGLDPTSQKIARQIATRPDPSNIVTPPKTRVDASSGLSGLGFAAWTTGSLSGASFLGALVLELLTQPLIKEYKEVGQTGSNKGRYDTLKLALEQRRFLMGALLVTGTATAITSGVLFWLDEGQDEGLELAPQQAGVDLLWMEGGVLLRLGGRF